MSKIPNFKSLIVKKDKLKDGKKISNNKSIENLVVLIIILIIVIISINCIWKSDKKKIPNQQQVLVNVENYENQLGSSNLMENKDDLEQKLERILSNINGVRRIASFTYIF